MHDLGSERVPFGQVTREPWASRTSCAHGHPWTPETTRWRIRPGKGERAPTRDCLPCRRAAERRRRKRGTNA